MKSRKRETVLAALPRLPVPLFALLLLASALHASCGGQTDDDPMGDDDAGVSDDAPAVDAPSEDSAEDRADGMSYGDAYLR